MKFTILTAEKISLYIAWACFRNGQVPGGGGGHSLVSSVPMRDQKNDEKGYFFSRRAVRSADII